MKKLLALLFVVIFASLSLVSCFFPNADKAEELLEDEDYEVRTVKEKEIEFLFEEIDIDLPDCKDIVVAMNEDEDMLIIIYCESSSDAKDLEADLEKALDDEDVEEMPSGEKAEVYRDGKVVCFGSKSAIKILK